MKSRLLIALRIALFPAFCFAGFVLYGYLLDFFSDRFPIPDDRSFIWAVLLMQGFATAAVNAAILSYPLAYVYRQTAVVVAFGVCLPVLYLRLPEFIDINRSWHGLIVSSYEVGAFLVLLIGGSFQAYRRLGSNLIMNGDANLRPLSRR
jgi:MFS family permease